MPEIKVHVHADGLGAAIEKVFPAGRVIVGRRADCDVVLDSRHAQASGRHLAIDWAGGQLTVEDLDSTNGTTVNGQRVTTRTRLVPGDLVKIEPHGPVIAAEVLDPLQRTLEIDPEEVKPRTSVGLETMTRMVRATVHRERRRSYVVAALALALGGAAFYVLRRDTVRTAALEAIRIETGRLVADAQLDQPEPEDFQSVLASVAESVYVVIKRTERDGDSSRIVESGSGTAWSIREGLLGTNAHVADLFAELEPGETLVARSNTSPPEDLRITGVRIHPGYIGFSALIERIRPYDKSSAEVLDLPPAYDVALLEVNVDDVARQAPPLRLASNKAVYALQAGQSIAFVGFPGEGLVRGGTDLARPSAKTAIGSINRVIDPFFGRPEDVSLAHCLEYNIEVVGGASGSPIVDASGQVIGLINAGDVLSQTANGRVGTGGTSYGPRVDTIRALVEGEGEAEWQVLLPKIRARMLEIFRDGSLEAEEHAGQVGTLLLDSIARSLALQLEHKFSWTFKGKVTLDRSGLVGRESFEVPAGASGLRAIIAIAEGSPIGVRMEGRHRRDRERLVERPSDSGAASTVDIRVILPAAGAGPIQMNFRADADEYFAPGEIAVFVLRLD